MTYKQLLSKASDHLLIFAEDADKFPLCREIYQEKVILI